MALSLQDKIEIILSLDEDILIPSSSYTRNRIFYKLSQKYEDFFEGIYFTGAGNGFSDELYHIFFDMHSDYIFESVRKINEYYKISKNFREAILEMHEDEIKKQKGVLEEIKEDYIKIFNEEIPGFDKF